MFEVKKSCLLKRRIRTVFFNILIKHAKKIQHFKIKTQLGSGTSAHLGPLSHQPYICVYILISNIEGGHRDLSDFARVGVSRICTE